MTNTPLKPFRFIPFRAADIIEMCARDMVSADDAGQASQKSFSDFCTLLTHVFHYEFKCTMEALKNAYSSMDPDTDTRLVFADESSTDSNRRFVALLKETLEKANYEAITADELNQAMTKSSLFNLRLHVDFDEFENVLLFCRGPSVQREIIRRWFGLSKKTIEFINYDRVVIYIQFKESCNTVKHDDSRVKGGASILKLFQNVPKADLEMLFPNTQLRMRLQDKLLIGVPALVSGGIVLTTKLGATLLLVAAMVGFWVGLRQYPVEMNAANLAVLFGGLSALAAYIWKQFSNFKNRKLRFMQQLTQNLYFKNLDNNAGVIYRLLNDAEEEECKEAILAYYFLMASKEPLSRRELDQKIEHWLAENWDCAIDFEIDDALEKLVRLGLVQCEQHRYIALPLKEAKCELDKRWDTYFSFNG